MIETAPERAPNSAPTTSLARRVFLGMRGTSLGLLLIMTNHIVMVPLLLLALGKDLYGDWLTLSAAAMYLALLDVGVQSHFVNRLNKAWTNHDHADFTRTLNTVTAFFLIVWLGILAVLLASSMVVSWKSVLNLTHLSNWDAVAIMLLCATGGLASGSSGVVGGLYGTIHQYHRFLTIVNIGRALQLAITPLVLWLVPRPLALACIFAGIQVATVIAGAITVQRREPSISIGLCSASWSVFRESSRGCFLFALPNVGQLLWLQGTSLVVAVMQGAAEVAGYVVPRTLFLISRQLHLVVNQPLWYEVTKLVTTGEYTRAARLLRVTAVYSGFSAACLAAALWGYGGWVVTLWTGHRIVPSSTTLLSLTFLVLSTGFWYTTQVFLLATDNQRIIAWQYAFSGLVSVGLTALLVPYIGTDGAAVAFAASDSIMSVSILRSACRVVRASPWPLVRTVYLRGIILFAASVLACYTVRSIIGPSTHLEWAASVLLSLIPLCLGFFIALPRDLRKEFVDRAFNLLLVRQRLNPQT